MKKLILISLLFFFFESTIKSQVITDGLIGHWQLNGNAEDQAANPHDGVVLGPVPAEDRFGTTSGALAFNMNQHVTFGDHSLFDFGANDFTLSIWFYRTSSTVSYNGVVLTKWNTGASPGTNEWSLGVSGGGPSGNLPGFSVEIGTNSYSAVAPNPVIFDQWTHMVAARRAGQIELYLNGTLVAQTTIPNQAINNVGRNMNLGQIHDNGGFRWLNGARLDDLQIFSRALSTTEIQAIYSQTPPSSSESTCDQIFCDGTNVGIGTQDTHGHKLAVAGSIIGEKVKVALVENWPDYVFDHTYDLRSLPELEKYITSEKHLPDVPSAAEVDKNGIELGKMNAALLKKIEELTLYLLEQHKRNNRQQELLETQADQLRKLQEEINDLKAGLKDR